MSDLVERVARAIAETYGDHPYRVDWQDMTNEAIAALRVALEEAARVADAENVEGDDPEVRSTAAFIGSAIRDLIPKEGRDKRNNPAIQLTRCMGASNITTSLSLVPTNSNDRGLR